MFALYYAAQLTAALNRRKVGTYPDGASAGSSFSDDRTIGDTSSEGGVEPPRCELGVDIDSEDINSIPDGGKVLIVNRGRDPRKKTVRRVMADQPVSPCVPVPPVHNRTHWNNADGAAAALSETHPYGQGDGCRQRSASTSDTSVAGSYRETSSYSSARSSREGSGSGSGSASVSLMSLHLLQRTERLLENKERLLHQIESKDSTISDLRDDVARLFTELGVLREDNARLAAEMQSMEAAIRYQQRQAQVLPVEFPGAARLGRNLSLSSSCATNSAATSGGSSGAVTQMKRVLGAILDDLCNKRNDPRLFTATLDDFEVDEAVFLAKGSFGFVSAVPHRHSNVVVAMKCLSNFDNISRSPLLVREHGEEYEFPLRHPHWAMTTIFNAWRGHTPDALYASYDPNVLYRSDDISEEKARASAQFLRYLHPRKTTVVTMELCLGCAKSYDFERDAGGNIPESEALAYAVELLCAIAHIASCNRAHMDVKPDNLLVTAGRGGVDGEIQILICDYGTVIERSDDLRREVDGSPMVRAPEAMGVGGSNLGTDVWAAGCTLAMLVGDIRGFPRNQLVNPADHDACLEAELLPPLDTHPRLRALIRALVTIDINKRPSPREARALAEALLFEANFAKYRFLPDPRMADALFVRARELADEIEASAEAGDGVPMMTYLEARMLAHNTADGLADAVERARELVARETGNRRRRR